MNAVYRPPMHAVAWPGHVVADRYRLQDQIGRGAMGTVWRARDELLDRDVAVKEVKIPPALSAGDRSALYERTLREARTAARLNHPGVVTVFDVVEEDGRPWIIMELVQARSLDQVLTEDGPLPVARAASIGSQLVSALTTAHAAGVLHRDVKPSNVLLCDDGRAVLTDFGIATLEGDAQLTQTGMVMGTPAFTPPERIRGEPATPASDLWSLGATLYAAVQGRGPYTERGGAITTMNAVIYEDTPVAQSAGQLGPVIAALMCKDPAARPDAAGAARMLAGAVPGGAPRAGGGVPGTPGGTPRPQNPVPGGPVPGVPVADGAAQVPWAAGGSWPNGAPERAGSPGPAAAGVPGVADRSGYAAGPGTAGGTASADGSWPAGGPWGTGRPGTTSAPGTTDGAWPGATPGGAAAPAREAWPAGGAASAAAAGRPGTADGAWSGAAPGGAAAPAREAWSAGGAAAGRPGTTDGAWPPAAPGQPGAPSGHAWSPTGGAGGPWQTGSPGPYSPGGGPRAQAAPGGTLRAAPVSVAGARGARASRRAGRTTLAICAAAAVVAAGVLGGFAIAHFALSSGSSRPRGKSSASHATTPTSTSSSPSSTSTSSTGSSGSPTAPAALPAGYTWYSQPASAAGTTAGFRLAVPSGWQASSQGLATYIKNPSGTGFIEVDLTQHTYPNDMAEARWLQTKTLSQHKFPGYRRIAIRPANIAGSPGAIWTFSWFEQGTGRVIAQDYLFNLATTGGTTQSYAVYTSAPRASWPQTAQTITEAIQTFQLLP